MSVLIEPLTNESFAPFGKVIASPLPASLNAIPGRPPCNASYANQNTALKYPEISPLTSEYGRSSSGVAAHPTMSLFCCFPRDLRTSNGHSVLNLRILERHPFTTQTFMPLCSPASRSTRAIIIVAPTLNPPTTSPALTPRFPHLNQGGPPDLQNLRAFAAEPGKGVAYGVGTWHAPMMVVGEGRMDFAVTQWINGQEGEDCQEVELTEEVEIVIGSIGNGERQKVKL